MFIQEPLFMLIKRKVIFSLVIFLLSLFVGSSLQAQENVERGRKLRVKNPEGTEFWLCFERNYKEPKSPSASDALILELFITGNKDANVKIEIEGIGYRKSITVKGETVANIKIPAEAQVRSAETPERLGVHITSDNPISVYGLNRRFQTTDTYLGLPNEVLGMEYRVMCYLISDGLLSQFAIVATEDNTNVEIIPTVNTTSHQSKQPFSVQLRKGDVYQIIARNDPYSSCDLTGSYIKANKKISVFSGHQCSYVPSKVIACNHLVEQLPPIPAWGKHFYLGELKPRSQYTFRVLANEDQTKIFEDAKLIKTLNGGEYYEGLAKGKLQITANKPVLVAQYSQGFRNGDSIGDPMMLLISPTQQFLQQYRFATPVNGSWEHYINVIAPTNAIATMKLNGKPIHPSNFEPLGISRYSIAYLRIPFGTHLLEGDLPFGMYSYGFGYDKDAFDAYGTMGGQSFSDYEPVKDTIPPMADENEKDGILQLIVRDDRVDDSGLKEVNIIANEGFDAVVPKLDPGSPQVAIKVAPTVKASVARLVIEAKDLALNKANFTICYFYDAQKGKYSYRLSEGIVDKCQDDPQYQIGGFIRYGKIFHTSDFASTGNVNVKGKFSDASGSCGYIGFLAGKRVYGNLNVIGRLSLESFGGTIEAPDSAISYVMDQYSGELRPIQESNEIELKGLFINLAASVEYTLYKSVYGIAGLNVSLNLSDKITHRKKIIVPEDFYYYPSGTREQSEEISLGSINALRLGGFIGLGFTVPINYNFSAFAEGIYNHYFSNMISDGDWKTGVLGFNLGLRYRFNW